MAARMWATAAALAACTLTAGRSDPEKATTAAPRRVACGPGGVWAPATAAAVTDGWCGLGDAPAVVTALTGVVDLAGFAHHGAADGDESGPWEAIRDGLLPADVAAAGVPVFGGAAPSGLPSDSPPLFAFRARGGLVDDAIDLDRAGLGPRREPTHMPLDRLVAELGPSTNLNIGSSSGGGGGCGDGEQGATSALLYYSAQVLEFRAGRLHRSVPSPVVKAAASRLAAAAANVSGRVQANVWLGSAGVCTPLHLDERANLLSVAVGRKRVVLYPPAAATGAGLLPWASSLARSARGGAQLGSDTGSSEGPIPAFGGHDALVASLGPGDALFIPPFWLHHVCNERASVSFSVWRDADPPLPRALGVLFDASRLPFASHWTTCERVEATVALCVRLAGSREAAAALAEHFQARYDNLVGAGDDRESSEAAAACRPPSQWTADEATGRLWPAEDDVDLAERAAAWVEEGAAALATHVPNEGARVIVLGNVLERMLAHAFGLTASASGDSAGKARAVVGVAASLSKWFERKATA